MSKHLLTIEVDVDDERLGSRDENGVGSAKGPIVPVDVSEWGLGDLTFAIDHHRFATATIVDYSAVLDPAEQRAAAEADSRARSTGGDPS